MSIDDELSAMYAQNLRNDRQKTFFTVLHGIKNVCEQSILL